MTMGTAITRSIENDPLKRMVAGLLSRPDDVSSETLHQGLEALRGYLRRRFSPLLSAADVDDIAAEAVVRLLESARRGMLSPGGNPIGYLLRIASLPRCGTGVRAPCFRWKTPVFWHSAMSGQRPTSTRPALLRRFVMRWPWLFSRKTSPLCR
jgi:hypothetical protein